MRRIHVSRTIEAPAADVWALLVDTDRWPQWGPTVKAATLSSELFELGSRGRVTTSPGLTLPFEVTEFTPGRSWAWKVAGVPATDHEVEMLGSDRCRVTIGVPPLAWPYLTICRLGLQRIERLVSQQLPRTNTEGAEPASPR